MKLLFKYPTRNRPRIFVSLLERYYGYLSGCLEFEFVITLDCDDPTMNNHEMLRYLDSKEHLTYHVGNSKTKIQAVNADLEGKSFDILFLISDDMVPVVPNFDLVIAEEMQRHFPALDGCLHFDDGQFGRELNALSIMGRNMYEMFGYIYHPDYTSLWCDNEFHAVSVAIGKYVYIDTMIVKNAWSRPAYQDELRQKTESFYGWDQAVFKLRQSLGFPIARLTDVCRDFPIAESTSKQSNPVALFPPASPLAPYRNESSYIGCNTLTSYYSFGLPLVCASGQGVESDIVAANTALPYVPRRPIVANRNCRCSSADRSNSHQSGQRCRTQCRHESPGRLRS